MNKLALFAAFIIGFEHLKNELEQGTSSFNIGLFWRIMIRWVIPILVAAILLNGILNA